MLEPLPSQLTEATEAESKYQPSGLADCPQILVLHTVMCSPSTLFPSQLVKQLTYLQNITL